MKKIKTKGKNEDAATFATWDCGSRLYDSYELVSLSHVIDRHLMELPYSDGSKRPMTGISHPTDFTPVSIADPTSNSIAKESSSLRSSSQVLEEKKGEVKASEKGVINGGINATPAALRWVAFIIKFQWNSEKRATEIKFPGLS
ncbi:hypothetical protein Golob_016974 [Gossypium lobatum]|uniref:Uncharacterized protein n=1 Tax=Gossypium lobatum TaxID=34289 RepID=A0A7J8M5Q9_9ROSI|nr:hypothetical protein [Gossypium lobatum]